MSNQIYSNYLSNPICYNTDPEVRNTEPSGRHYGEEQLAFYNDVFAEEGEKDPAISDPYFPKPNVSLARIHARSGDKKSSPWTFKTGYLGGDFIDCITKVDGLFGRDQVDAYITHSNTVPKNDRRHYPHTSYTPLAESPQNSLTPPTKSPDSIPEEDLSTIQEQARRICWSSSPSDSSIS